MKTFSRKNAKPTINRMPYTKEHPFTRVSNSLLILEANELAIMIHLLSNSDKFVINKSVIESRLNLPGKKFDIAWNSLKNKGYIEKELIQGGVKWIINEKPNNDISNNEL